jgi:ACS family tartrate transporter-like MFS transporter
MHLAGWQWLFLIEGLPAVLFGLVVLRYLPDEPRHASWLTTNEQEALSSLMDRERAELGEGKRHLLAAVFADPLVWLLGVTYFLGSICSYGLTLWMPEILKGLSGLSNALVGLLSALPYLVATIATLAIGRHSDRTGERVRHVAATCLVGAVGFAVAAFLRSPWLGLAALTVAAAGTFSRNGPFWALPTLFLSGRGAAGGIAFINTIGALGGFAGPYVIGLVKKATGSFAGGLLFMSAALLVAAALVLALQGALRGLGGVRAVAEPRPTASSA